MKKNKLFISDRFTPTKWDTAQDKADFANQFVKFCEGDFRPADFTIKFYRRLSLTFGHIAHYDRDGFYNTFFTSNERIVDFFRFTRDYPCYGDPAYTYSDVEKALQYWLQDSGLLEKWLLKQSTDQEAEERATLARLKAKFEAGSGVPEDHIVVCSIKK